MLFFWLLYFIYQRYDFESKSQQNCQYVTNCYGCISYTKGTTLKANHNIKTQRILTFRLYFIYQRYDFESKSQRNAPHGFAPIRCISYTKGTTLKANHNSELTMISDLRLYFIYQRYDFESKSQQK